MNIEKEITIPELIEQIGDLNIFSYYIPNLVLNRPMLSVFRKEKNPSFVVSSRGNQIRYKDYGDSQFKGNCIDLVKQLYHLSTSEAINKIKEDFGLIDKSNNKYNQVISSLPKIEVAPKIPVKIIAEAKNLGKEHINYLAQYELTLEDMNFCSDTEVLPLKKFWINGTPITLGKNEVGFIYYVKSLDKVKIYRPQASKDLKWFTNLNFSYIHGLDNLKNCHTGIVGKSIKDCAVVYKYITKCTCVVQSENPDALSDDNINFINSNCSNIYTSFDNDEKGVISSQNLNKKTGWGYINPPKELLNKGITDWADMIKVEGKDKLIEYFQSKKII